MLDRFRRRAGPSRKHPAEIVAAWIGAGAVVLAALIGAAALVHTSSGDAVPTPPETSASPGGQSTHPEPGDAAAATNAECRDPATGGPVDCSVPGSGILLVTGQCTDTTPHALFGRDASSESFLVAVTRTNEGCILKPATEATRAGATGADIRRATEGTISASIRECARHGNEVIVACSEPHEIEYVGGWFSSDDTPSAVASECGERAKRYTARPMIVGDELGATVVSDGNLHRCAVRVQSPPLTSSVHDLGGGPLPRG